MQLNEKFDELSFFAEVKKRPNFFLRKRSIIALRDFVAGMDYVFYIDGCYDKCFEYFNSFIEWYHSNLDDKNGYACWWNHILYRSGNNDADAFDRFFKIFEQYLKDVHNISLPEAVR